MNDREWFATYLPHEIGTVLSLRNLSLEFIPDTLWERIQGVSVLDLSFNALTSIPDTLGLCTSLQELWLNNNGLTSLPTTFSNLGLTRLDVSYNNLSSLINVNSIIIDASHNNISEVDGLSANTCILNLTDNNLSDVSDSVCELPNLQVLNICNNEIVNIPSITARFNHKLSEFWY